MGEKQTVILYHGGCPDGFGGAYAAWKKFGEHAEYIPLSRGEPVPEGFAGRQLYFIDFTYPKEIMDRFAAEAASIVVLDHHLGVQDVVEAMPEHVFDTNRSGAVIAWEYFHPDTPVPIFLRYVQEGDLWRFSLPDSRAVLAYAYAQKFSFEEWDRLVRDFEDAPTRAAYIEKGRAYAEHFTILAEQIANKAQLVTFEGHECLLVGAASMFTSDVGAELAKRKPPMGIMLNMNKDVLHVSLRSVPGFDASAIARKYGGNGHPQAAGFILRWGDPLPWKNPE